MTAIDCNQNKNEISSSSEEVSASTAEAVPPFPNENVKNESSSIEDLSSPLLKPNGTSWNNNDPNGNKNKDQLDDSKRNDDDTDDDDDLVF